MGSGRRLGTCLTRRLRKCSSGRLAACATASQGCVLANIYPYVRRSVLTSGAAGSLSDEFFGPVSNYVVISSDVFMYGIVIQRRFTSGLCVADEFGNVPTEDVTVECNGEDHAISCTGYARFGFGTRNLGAEIPGSGLGYKTAASVTEILYLQGGHYNVNRGCGLLDPDDWTAALPACGWNNADVPSIQYTAGCSGGAAVPAFTHLDNALGASWLNRGDYEYVLQPDGSYAPGNFHPPGLAISRYLFLGEAHYWIYFDEIVSGPVDYDLLRARAEAGRLLGQVRQFGSRSSTGTQAYGTGSGSVSFSATGEYLLEPNAHSDAGGFDLAWQPSPAAQYNRVMFTPSPECSGIISEIDIDGTYDADDGYTMIRVRNDL